MSDTCRCSACLQDVPDCEPRQPCPRCGGMGRTFDQTMTEAVRLADEISELKHKKKGRKKLWYHMRNRMELSHKTGELNRREFIRDRENDYYFERVTSPTGEVIHFCEEPLSKHQGHGSAKVTKPEPDRQ